MTKYSTAPPKKKSMPWKGIFSDLYVWGLAIGQFGHGWIFFTFNTDLPKFLKEVLHFDIKANGLINALPSLGMWISSILSGLLADYLIKKEWRILTVRRIWTIFGQ